MNDDIPIHLHPRNCISFFTAAEKEDRRRLKIELASYVHGLAYGFECFPFPQVPFDWDYLAQIQGIEHRLRSEA